MCGIVGYIGDKRALPVLISGLESLEYRGYDSAGVALIEQDRTGDKGKVEILRSTGKLAELKKVLASDAGNSSVVQNAKIGIGHTRWATHGRPTETNAHPHGVGRVSLIHNGIIENYLELKRALQGEGRVFKSETDTEVAAHLLEKELLAGKAPIDALKAVCQQVRGSYAFLAIDSENPDQIVVAKNSTPIIIGIGDGENFVASDIPAILSHTRKMVILEDGDIAQITAEKVEIENSGRQVTREIMTIVWDPVTAQKGGYKHFMLKEIYDQGRVLSDTLRGRFSADEGTVLLPELSELAEKAPQISRIIFVACGTAWHACLEGKFLIESLAGIPCEVDYASEFRYRSHLVDSNTLVIAVSQSGETLDTLGAIECISGKCMTMAVCNVVAASLCRKVQMVLHTHAGPEISVASTKAFTTQLIALYLFALFLGQHRKTLTPTDLKSHLSALIHLPTVVGEILKLDKSVGKIAKKFHQVRDFLFLGRGTCYPIALEGALKMKELSYIHAEGYPAGEMKHGPIALIDEEMPVVMVLQQNAALYQKTIGNIKEVEARGARVIIVTDAEDQGDIGISTDAIIRVPFISDSLSPLLLNIPLQFLAYHVAVLNGTDVDLPRNLAKSVTVE